MITTMCGIGYLKQVMRFAERTGQLEQLKEQFTRLRSRGDVVLYRDHCDNCFQWEGNGMFGGLIYHGQAGEVENFSIQLSPRGGWQIHT